MQRVTPVATCTDTPFPYTTLVRAQVEPLIGARRAYLLREVQNAFIATRDDAMHLRCQFTARVLMLEIPERGDAGMAGECRRADRIDPFRVVGEQRDQQRAIVARPEIGRA